MATSAFRSTTRRSGKTSPAFGSDPPPPTPRANNHRRAQSLSDFSHRYFSDSGSTTDAHSNRNADGCRPRSRRPSSHYLPYDSESDMDGGQRRFRRSFDVGNGRGFSDTAANNDALHQQPRLRRASSHQELSQNSTKNHHRHKIYYNNIGINNSEDYIKEKAIGAVYDQIKRLRRGPHVEDQSFYNAIRAEVRREVAEIRKELELCMKKKCSLVDSPDIEAFTNQNKDVIQAMTEIRKEYGTKIKESEKKVRELWSQWAVEERRRLELSKIVNELLPSIGHGSHRQNGSIETQLSKQLEEDAQTLLEDFISTPNVGLSGDIEDKTNHKEDKDSTGFKSKGQVARNDRVLLPRLHWESDSLTNGKKTPKKVICSSGELGARLMKRNNLLSTRTRSSVKDSINSTNNAPSTQSNSNVDKDEVSNQVRLHRCLMEVPEKVVEGRVDFDVHNFLLEKLRYRERVGQGEMILCGPLSFEIH